MMQEHFYCNYTLGNDAYTHVAAVCSPYGTRALLVGGKKALAAGEAKLKKALEGTTVQIAQTVWYGGDCTYAHIDAIERIARELNVDMIFGMGGGRALDTAKAVADRVKKPVFTFPTSASTCAATTALSVVYKDTGEVVVPLYRFPRPAYHTFIDTAIIAKAPWILFQAGIGDTLAKFFECHFASRGDRLTFSDAMGRSISNMCYEPQIQNAVQALKDVKSGIDSVAVTEVILANIVATGLVSTHVQNIYNTALAHPVYYGLEVYPGFSEDNLHGNAVAYGILIQLIVDKEFEKAREFKAFLQALGIRTTLKEMHVKLDREALREALHVMTIQPDLEHGPYKITEDMIFEAMTIEETL